MTQTDRIIPGALTFLGYIARDIWTVDAAFKAAASRPGARDHLAEVCSVSNCISDSYRVLDRWDFNAHGHFDTIAEARNAVPEEKRTSARIFAHWQHPVLFDKGVANVLPDEGVASPAEPAPGSVTLLGFDPAVVRLFLSNWHTGFDCSPLTCNGYCDEHRVNEHALVDSFDEALRLAKLLSQEHGHQRVYGVVCVGEVVRPG